jgi:hypothetical protein
MPKPGNYNFKICYRVKLHGLKVSPKTGMLITYDLALQCIYPCIRSALNPPVRNAVKRNYILHVMASSSHAHNTMTRTNAYSDLHSTAAGGGAK